jgi:alkylated DNA nucleotide flippase Atl1
VLALAHHFAAMIRAGDVADYADLARLTGFTRARITQMMDLTLLAPDIQEQILTWPRVSGERGAPSEKRVLVVAREVEWGRQRERWGLLSDYHVGREDLTFA